MKLTEVRFEQNAKSLNAIDGGTRVHDYLEKKL
jgi:hypothetical protein